MVGLEGYDILTDVVLSGASIHLCFQGYSLANVPILLDGRLSMTRLGSISQ